MYENQNPEEQAPVEQPAMSYRIQTARAALSEQVAFFTSQFGR